jgi:hypothetical protein
MSFADWYKHKAAQCLRLAGEATDPKKRTGFQEEAVLWREIGADAIKQERENHPS